jgi:hypothetical protein
MSTVDHEVSARRVAANQANAQKSTGPKTAEGKARVALNAIKHGAYAKADNLRRELMRTRGEDPAEYDELLQDLTDSCQPDNALQAILVKTVGDKAWEKLQLRRVLMDGQLGSLQLAQARRKRRQHAARRWPGNPLPGAPMGLCGTRDSEGKFTQILEHLDRLEQWLQQEICPDEYPEVMEELYDKWPTVAGHRIRALFIQLFNGDEAQRQSARQELPQWIAKEKSDVLEDRNFYHRELALRGYDGASMPEQQVAAREAALERQMAEQTRLLLQLKAKRSVWESASLSPTAVQGGTETTVEKGSLEAEKLPNTEENGPQQRTKPPGGLESMT